MACRYQKGRFFRFRVLIYNNMCRHLLAIYIFDCTSMGIPSLWRSWSLWVYAWNPVASTKWRKPLRLGWTSRRWQILGSGRRLIFPNDWELQNGVKDDIIIYIIYICLYMLQLIVFVFVAMSRYIYIYIHIHTCVCVCVRREFPCGFNIWLNQNTSKRPWQTIMDLKNDVFFIGIFLSVCCICRCQPFFLGGVYKLLLVKL